MVRMSIGALPGQTREKTSLVRFTDAPSEKSPRAVSWGAVCCGLLLLNSTPWLSAQVQDQVFESGTPTRCSILSVSRDSLRVSDNGQQREIPVNTIRKVVFGNEPNELKDSPRSNSGWSLRRCTGFTEETRCSECQAGFSTTRCGVPESTGSGTFGDVDERRQEKGARCVAGIYQKQPSDPPLL